ncbi:MAG: exo-alpha-sialidase [Bacteroidales bacterium]|jgi:hypothetical protein
MNKTRFLPDLIVLLLFITALRWMGIAAIGQVTPSGNALTVQVITISLPAGSGNGNERLIGIKIIAGSGAGSLNRISFNLSGTTDISDLTEIRIFFNGQSERFNPLNAILFAKTVPARGEIEVKGDMPLKEGDNYFWITADLSPNAREGNQIGALVLSVSTSEGPTIPMEKQGASRTILLASKLLFSGGDGGSMNYRIPAIVKAMDGSLVTATDKRWTGPVDLPNDIDVVIRRSIDRGMTWSDPLTIAGNHTTIGYGDPVLMVNRKNGEIICIFASDKGWTASTAAAPLRINQARSTDNGITWSTSQDITSQIYGAESNDPVTRNWQGAFVASGAATQLRSGRLMAVIAARQTDGFDISNFVIYSDDGALTWKVSTNRAFAKGDEAKVVELDNGEVLMSIRQKGSRWFNISRDQGMTWGTPFKQGDIIDPFCNGDLIRLSALSDGDGKNRLLHSIPYAASRKNISVLLSYDEGVTWPVRKTIYSGPSAYSSLTVLEDGTIGMYYEAGEYETYQMYFVRFSLEWLTDGKDR